MIQDIVEINRLALDVGRRLALIDTSVCARLLRIANVEADALANMSDATLEHLAQSGMSLLVLEPARPVIRLPTDSPAELLDLERQLDVVFAAVHAAAHRYATESPFLGEMYFRITADEVKRLTTMTELDRRALHVGCALRIDGLAAIVELINRERSLPSFKTKLNTAMLASRLSTLPR